MFTAHTHRPRNVNSYQAAGILYGDWGTSKAYVVGLAFALSGHQSFWYILAVSVLTALVALNYITVCKYYPQGGGVYSSARAHSQVVALVGAFFLCADFLVTAALSALSAMHYAGAVHPQYWAIAAIAAIGVLNYFGPRHSGNVALALAIPTVIVVVLLGLLTVPKLEVALDALKPPSGSLGHIWKNFVGVIVALSGIEAIANATGVMQLDKGCTKHNLSVVNTSTPAILSVMMEVCFFTTLFALAANALPGLVEQGAKVLAPSGEDVRDYLLSYMGEVFATQSFGPTIGHLFGIVVSVVFCVLLLSAVNTAVVALVSLMYVVASDKQLPTEFLKLNSFGVPVFPLLLVTLIPMILISVIHDIAGLADLYAVGFVGAIATNLGYTAFNKKLPMYAGERVMMFCTFLIMAAIELTLIIEKQHARNFIIALIAIGLLLRALVFERREKKRVSAKRFPSAYQIPVLEGELVQQKQEAVLCAVSFPDRTLDFALEECKVLHKPLYVLYVKSQKNIADVDLKRSWLDDEKACRIVDRIVGHLDQVDVKFIYMISDSVPEAIVETAKQLHITRLIMGMPRQQYWLQFFRGNLVYYISKILPRSVELVVVS